MSYGVVHELLDALVGRGHAADVEETAAAYGEFLDAMAGARAAEIRPYVFRLRGLGADEASDALLAGVAPAILRERMTSATAEIIAAATAGRPTIVRVEDLHWADASSVSLIRALAGHPALGHVLVLFTTRPDPGLAREWIEQLRSVDVPSVIELRPLPDAVIRDLLEHTLAGDDASPGLREQIRAKAQGNPFYLVSFLRSLLDDGIATLCAGRLHVTGNVVAMHVPETLHAAVGSRIDKLRPREKHVLRWGSVLGSTFSPAHVEALARAESGSGDVDLALSLLAERQLIEPEPDGRMRFVHAVVQDVAYEGMLERDRRRLHATVARLLGAEAAQTSEADIALLAWHHEHAGEREKASLRYAQASKLAANGFANREEIGYLESALRLADPQDIARTDALIERLGDVLQITGRFADAGARFEAIRAREQAETLDAVRVRRKLAKAWTSQQRFPETNAMIAEARGMLDRLRREPPDERWWREHFGVELFAMWAMYMQARNAELAELADRLAPEIEIHATLAERGLFHRSVALLELRQSRYRASLSTVAVAAQSADELRRAGNIAELGLANFGHAFALLWSGAVAEADERLQEVLRDTTRVGDAERNMLCLTYLAVTARMLHDVDRAEAFARAAISASLRNGSKHYEGVAYANLAWVAWRRGDGTAADEHVCTARRLCTLQGYPFDWLHGLVALARALERADDAAAAGEVRAMAADSQQLLRDGMQEALEATAADPTLETMKALLDVAIRAGYA